MIVFPYQLEERLSSPSDSPVYVLEILWADGMHGKEGVNDIYFSTADVSDIAGFPFPDRLYPILDPKKVSSVSSRLDVKNGVSTIGKMTFDILNIDKVFSKIVIAAENAGHGLRRQRAELYMLDRKTGWGARVKRRTLQIDDFKHDPHTDKASLVCADIQRLLKKTIFDPAVTYLAQNISAVSTSIYLGSSTAVPDLTFLSQPVHGTACFVKIEDEIIKLSAFDANALIATVAIGGRGSYSTAAAAHAIPAEGMVVSELIVLRGNPVDIAMKALSVGLDSAPVYVPSLYDTYPSKWTAGLDYSGNNPELDLTAWEVLAAFVGFDKSVGASSGIQYEYIFDKGVEAKKFIEQIILRNVGGFSKILGNGAYSCAINPDLSAVHVDSIPEEMILTEDNVVKWGKLRYNYPKMVNRMRIEYDEKAILSNKFVRSTVFYDAASEAKWGKANELSFKAKGMLALAENINTMHARYIPMLARMANPPLSIKIEATRLAMKYEAGDVIRLILPIEDISAGGISLDRPFEVMGTSTNSWSGNVSLDLEAQPTRANIDSLTSAFIGDSPPRSRAPAYAIGIPVADINFPGNSTGYGYIETQSVYSFASDQTLLSPINIFGDVTWYIDGVLNINALIDGVGKGTYGSKIGFNAGGWWYGQKPNNQGYVGGGGRGGSVGTSGGRGWGALAVNPPLHASMPVIAPFLSGFDSSVPPIASIISGLDNNPFWGGGGGSSGYDISHGGYGGASLKIICRGINMQPNAAIDLRGTNGASGVGGGGGGGGGSIGIFVELAAGGLGTTRIINPAKIYLNGGSRGGATWLGYGPGVGFSGAPKNGGFGALISEVF